MSKASQLMSFLDDVETEIDEDVTSTIAGSQCGDYNEDDTMSIVSTATSTNNIFGDIKEKMIGLKVQLNDKTKTIELLEVALKKSQEKQTQIIAQNKKTLKKKLNSQKKEFQVVTNRHLLFVDRLLNDKENLSKKCEDLTDEIKKLQENCTNKINKLQNEHKKAMKRSKEQWMASEQIKREQWITNKTKQIKSMTIKGLEPEIERLIEENKKNLHLKEEEYTNLLRQEKENIYKLFEEKMENAQNKMNQDKMNEIDMLNEKHLNEIASINKLKETQLNEQMMRLNKQWNEERERNKLLHETTMNKLLNLHQDELTKCKQLNKEMIENNCKKHDIEIRKLNERCKIEKSEWIQIMNKKYNKEFKEKEIKMIELVKKQQKDEIDIIIDKLSSEYTQTINSMQAKHDKIMDESQGEIDEQKQECRKWMMQFEYLNLDTKDIEKEHGEKLKEMQAISEQKNAEIGGLESKLAAKAEEIATMNEEKQREIDELKQDYDARLQEVSDLQLKYTKCNDKLSKIEETYNAKMEELKNFHVTEIERIEARIRQTLCKKDDWILQLKDQIETKNMRIHQIENLLNEQRNQLFEQLG